jgi:isopentenyl-diphosphate delta-isomerase
MEPNPPFERPPEQVVLVDADDIAVGVDEKMAAHAAPGKRHRAVSVVIVDDAGRVMLQQRAATKHHFAGRWSNTCCTHPRPQETPEAAGERRLREEMGITASLTPCGSFEYRAEDTVSGLVEHEIDHVLVGRHQGDAAPDPTEVGAWEWVDPAALGSSMSAEPGRYTPWLAEVLEVAFAPGM